MGHDYSSSTYASSKYLPCPYLTSLGYFTWLNPIPSCWLGRGRRVPRRWLQLQCCIHDAGVLCCSLSLSSWLKPGTGKDTEKMAAANHSNSLLLGAPGDTLLVPLFLTVPSRSCVKWRDCFAQFWNAAGCEKALTEYTLWWGAGV